MVHLHALLACGVQKLALTHVQNGCYATGMLLLHLLLWIDLISRRSPAWSAALTSCDTLCMWAGVPDMQARPQAGRLHVRLAVHNQLGAGGSWVLLFVDDSAGTMGRAAETV